MSGRGSAGRKTIHPALPILFALFVMPVIGMVGYHYIEGWSLLDSLYMAIITLSTTGYGEVHPLTAGGKIFTMGLIVTGMLVLAYALGQAAQMLFSGEWRVRWQNQRRQRMLKEISNHVIVCGYGRIGSIIAAQLQQQNIPFVVIERDPARLQAAMMDALLAVQADASHEDVLKRVGIENARGLIAAVGTDAENVYTVLSARVLRPDMIGLVTAMGGQAAEIVIDEGLPRA